MTETDVPTPAAAFEAALAVVNREDHHQRIDAVMGHATSDATRRALAELALNAYDPAGTLAARVRVVVGAIAPIVRLLSLARDLVLALDALSGTEPTELERSAERVRAFLAARAGRSGIDPEGITGIGTSDEMISLNTSDLSRIVRAVLPGADLGNWDVPRRAPGFALTGEEMQRRTRAAATRGDYDQEEASDGDG